MADVGFRGEARGAAVRLIDVVAGGAKLRSARSSRRVAKDDKAAASAFLKRLSGGLEIRIGSTRTSCWHHREYSCFFSAIMAG